MGLDLTEGQKYGRCEMMKMHLLKLINIKGVACF